MFSYVYRVGGERITSSPRLLGVFYSYGRTDLASKNSGKTQAHSFSLLTLFHLFGRPKRCPQVSGLLLGEVKANGLVKMDHTNMKEQENLRRTTVPDVLAFLFEVTFVPLERCDFYVLLGLLA